MPETSIFKNPLLLPHRYRYIGAVLFLFGTVFAIMKFKYGITPEFLDCQVFAVYSVYFVKKHFAIIDNNITEEVIEVLLIAGLSCMVFAREKIENRLVQALRARSFLIALYCNSGFILFSIVFIYGFVFAGFLVAAVFLYYLFYLVVFWGYKIRYRKVLSTPDPGAPKI